MADELSLDWSIDPVADETDEALVEVFRAFQRADPDGSRTGKMMRRTLDQLYDGQRTGRYSWAQLHKTERTHFGTLFEINLRREFDDVIDEGITLDYRVAGHDVDCKFSQTMFQWMIPPEAIGHLLFVGHVNDVTSEFAVGIVRASAEHLRPGANRDAKVGLNREGRLAVRWLHRPGDLPPNVLLHADPADIAAIFANQKSGQARVNELFRRVVRQRIGRNAVATVAQQDDFMKRVRENGGARSSLRPEGFIILGGDSAHHRFVASSLGVVAPEPGELVSVRVTPATDDDPDTVRLDGGTWRAAASGEEPDTAAPLIRRR
ncbi:NaeI family type II restriction endonuclease [Rathayibacter sp. AY1F9]|uniref:NaeI family type II restriction endonuclease n=1 Tax=Rathayibacter sp. AY1F9 TaxID=2080563 RepID=UPI000CE77382|nr:NaeI family type II restriction endonuclease [Rathayibacter sp. AY1F9]PPH31423.1 restriction endonuclease [Rathayibacter sp. AY1F9]